VKAFTYSAQQITPQSYNWNLTMERNLANGWLLRTAYVAARGTRIIRNMELNPAVNRPGATTGNTDARRLFAPDYGSIRQYSPAANSTYHSLQATLNRRFAHGITVLANYTFSKLLDDMPNTTNIFQGSTPPTLPWYFANASKFDYGPAPFDHSQRAVISYVWSLPSVKSASGFVNKLASGWQWSGILQAQSGAPLTVTSGRDNSLTGIGADRAQLTGKSLDPASGVDRNVQFFNPAAFDVNPIGTFGNLGKGRLRGPGFLGFDMGASKTTSIREQASLQFRAEFFNTFNRVNFNDPNTNFNSPSFTQILAAQDPRIIQFGLKLSF
jgi:hypothetical protein